MEQNTPKHHKSIALGANLSHACMRDSKVLRRMHARHNKTEKNVRATMCTVFNYKTVQILKTSLSLSGDLVETDSTR